MELEEWWPWYKRILKTFGYSRRKDQIACEVLSNLLKGKAVRKIKFKKVIEGKACVVFGGGPSLEADVMRLAESRLLKACVSIAANGATSAFLEHGMLPTVIVSDLDGRIEDLLLAERMGSLIVVHAHGDNIRALKMVVPMLGKAFGTTQANPRPRVYNFGGFTDGDRAVILALEMGAKLVALAGMDFGRVIGKYSGEKPRSVEEKFMKLKIGKELLEWVASRSSVPLLNITKGGENVKGFKRASMGELERMV
jgi:hypothetical protein